MHFAKDQLLVCNLVVRPMCVLWQCSAVSAGVGDSIAGGQVADVCTTKILLLDICILYSFVLEHLYFVFKLHKH